MRTVQTVIATCLLFGAATGVALAQQKGAGSAAGSAAAGAPKPPPADKAADKAAPPAMEMPKPAQELVDMGKAMAGTWKCTGKVMMPTQRDTNGNLQFTLDLDKMWIKTTMTETKTKTPFKFESFVTYDQTSKKWAQVSIDNLGGYRVLTSDGMKDNAVTWTGQATGMGKTMQVKSVHTMVAAKDVKIDESMSVDSGKTWMPSVSVECKK
jgi:hypothetical protein